MIIHKNHDKQELVSPIIGRSPTTHDARTTKYAQFGDDAHACRKRTIRSDGRTTSAGGAAIRRDKKPPRLHAEVKPAADPADAGLERRSEKPKILLASKMPGWIRP